METANMKKLKLKFLIPVFIVSAVGVLFLSLSLVVYSKKLSAISSIVIITLLFALPFYYNRLLNPVARFILILDHISQGNCNINIDSLGKNQLAEIARSFSEIMGKFDMILEKVSENSSVFTNSCKEIFKSFQTLNKTTKQISYNVADITKGAVDQVQAIEKGNDSIKNVIDGLNELTSDMSESEKHTKKAKNAINVINDAIKINKLKMEISKSENAIQDQEFFLNETFNAFNEVCRVVEDSSDNIRLITAAANVLNKSAMIVEEQFDEFAAFSQQSAASMQEVYTSTEEQVSTSQMISECTKELFNIVQNFKSVEN